MMKITYCTEKKTPFPREKTPVFFCQASLKILSPAVSKTENQVLITAF